MNDIAKNTELFVNILGMSRTSAVQKWDHEAFQRAFRWANYFEQVHKKTKSKPHVSERIAKQLAEVSSQVDARLGLTRLTYNDLQNSTLILRTNLLQNPFLSNEFYLKLVSQFNGSAEDKEAFKNQIQSLSKLKATLQILQLIQKRFENLAENQSKQTEDNTDGEAARDDQMTYHFNVTKGQIAANGVLLKKCLVNVITQGSSLTDSKKRQLHVKLQHMIEHDKGIDVLLMALVSDEDEDEKVTNYLMDFIQDILVPKWKQEWKSFLQLPLSQLLSKCACMHERFLRICFELSKHCGDQLQKELTKHDYMLLMENSQSSANEQMCKYYYFLLQNLLQTLVRVSPQVEINVEAFIRQQCSNGTREFVPVESDVWKKLSHDMMVSSEI